MNINISASVNPALLSYVFTKIIESGMNTLGRYTNIIQIGKEVGSYTFDASLKKVTISGFGSFNLGDIVFIGNLTRNEMLFVPFTAGKSATISGNEITLEFDTTSYDDGDELVIYANYNNSEDYTLGVTKQIEQAPLDQRYTDPELLVSAQNLTSSYVQFGSDIDVLGKNKLGLTVKSDCNDSQDVLLKIVGVFDDEEVTIDGVDVETLWSGIGTDSSQYFEINVGTLPFIRVYALAGTVGSNPGDLTIKFNKKW